MGSGIARMYKKTSILGGDKAYGHSRKVNDNVISWRRAGAAASKREGSQDDGKEAFRSTRKNAEGCKNDRGYPGDGVRVGDLMVTIAMIDGK